jgi:centrosomal CEP192-like protein
LLGGSSPTKNVTLTNVGGGTLTISGLTITGTDPADFSETNNCGASLPPGGYCTIGVTFTPMQLGSRTAALTITDSAPGSPQSVPLSGSGVTSGPNATLSPNSLTFATQLVNTTSPPQPITLSNYGTITLLITAIGTSGDFNQSNTCGKFLLPLASCTINVTFTPTARGNLSGMLSITDNAPGSPQTVSLTGVGTVVELNPASLSFGTVTIGQHKTLTTTVTNVGRTTLNLTSITISGAYFSQTNNCPLELAAQNSCNVSVTFAPEGAGNFNGAVSISDDGGGSPQQVSVSGTGRKRCSGACTFGRCASGCHCDKGVCVQDSDLLDELFLDWNPAASFACGSN